MKLHNNKENRILVNMAQQLAEFKNDISDIKEELLDKTEISQYEMADLAMYLSNKYGNEHNGPDHPDDNEINSLLHSFDQMKFFLNEYKDVVKQYYQNQLPPIQFKDDNLSGYVTVGDLRYSQYPDETPIVNMDESDNVSKGTSYRQDMHTCTNLNVSEVYLNADDSYILKEEKDVYIGCTKQPDSVFTIKGITF